MEYFYAFQRWLYGSILYQNILKEMPAPLNNIYFDSFLVIGLVIYLIYRLVEAIRIARYRKHIKKQRSADRQLQTQKEEEIAFREWKVQEKEERLGRFLDYMEYVFSRHMKYQEQSGNCRPGGGHRRLGSNRFLLGRKQIVGELPKKTGRICDYDVVMDAFASEQEQKQEVSKRQQREKEEMDVLLNHLEESLIVEETDAKAEKAVDVVWSADFEKRKARAIWEDKKDRKRTEKLLRKQERGGVRNGRFGK